MQTLGWRCWFDDGAIRQGSTWEDWCRLAAERPDRCLVKMLYYDTGGRQIQQGDWWLEARHPKGIIRRTCRDDQKAAMEEQHPDAVFIQGFWTVDEWMREIVDAAMTSTWEEAPPVRAKPELEAPVSDTAPDEEWLD